MNGNEFEEDPAEIIIKLSKSIQALQNQTERLEKTLNAQIEKYEETLSHYKTTTREIALEAQKQIREVGNIEKKDLVKSSLIFWVFGALAFLGTFLFFYFWIPSLEEISTRRAELHYTETKMERITKDLKFGTCDGFRCIKIRRNTCHYGSNRDFCLLP